jgi:hypothetical protein
MLKNLVHAVDAVDALCFLSAVVSVDIFTTLLQKTLMVYLFCAAYSQYIQRQKLL